MRLEPVFGVGDYAVPGLTDVAFKVDWVRTDALQVRKSLLPPLHNATKSTSTNATPPKNHRKLDCPDRIVSSRNTPALQWVGGLSLRT